MAVRSLVAVVRPVVQASRSTRACAVAAHASRARRGPATASVSTTVHLRAAPVLARRVRGMRTMASAASAESPKVATKGDAVKVHFVGKLLSDGSVFESTEGKSPLQFKLGEGQVMPGLERAVEGLAVGGEVAFEMTPEDAFGELDPKLIVDVPLEAAPEGLEVGMAVRLQGGQTARVTAMGDTTLTIDANHELAGQAVSMVVTLISAMDPAERFPDKRTDAEWKEQLGEFAYHVLRMKGTEPGGTGEYDKFYPESGYFKCAGCDQPLYTAQSKFDSGCGWPAFDKCFEGSIVTDVDDSMGMRRVEIMCGNCGGHLGHVFENERGPATERHCVNSVSVKYVDKPVPVGLTEAQVV